MVLAIKPASSRGFLNYSNQESCGAGAGKQIGSNLHLPLCIFINCRSGQRWADSQTALSSNFCLRRWINSCFEAQETNHEPAWICFPKCVFKSITNMEYSSHSSGLTGGTVFCQVLVHHKLWASTLLPTPRTLITWPEQKLLLFVTHTICIISPAFSGF